MDREPTLGECAFEGYKMYKKGKTYDDKPIPAWEAVGDDVRAACSHAAIAVKIRIDFLAMIHGRKK